MNEIVHEEMLPMKNAALPISLNQVLTRYWDLANLDTETTKGTITGQ